MVATTEAETTLRRLIVEWVDEQLGMGDDHGDAFQVAAERIKREGHSEAFVEEFATTVVREVYQARSRQQRHSALSGKRRVDVEALQGDDSLMDTIWYVDGRAVRLGDFNKALCQTAKGEFATKARGLIQDVNFLDQLQNKLKGGKTISAVFTDDQLRSMWESSRVMD